MLHFGEKIKELVESRGMSIPEFARQLGKTKPTVYEMLGKEDVNTAILKKIADIFGIGLSDFFVEDVEDIRPKDDSKDALIRIVEDQQRTIKYLREKLQGYEEKRDTKESASA